MLEERVFNPHGVGASRANQDWQAGEFYNPFHPDSQEWFDYSEQQSALLDQEMRKDLQELQNGDYCK